VGGIRNPWENPFSAKTGERPALLVFAGIHQLDSLKPCLKYILEIYGKFF
jgi:hypothetical protein